VARNSRCSQLAHVAEQNAGRHHVREPEAATFPLARTLASSKPCAVTQATARVYEAGNSAAFAAIRTCPVPVIAAIRGICFGGGFGIAAAADHPDRR
jgi:hypothetical protein